MCTLLTRETAWWLVWILVAVAGAIIIIRWPPAHPPLTWVLMVAAVGRGRDRATQDPATTTPTGVDRHCRTRRH